MPRPRTTWLARALVPCALLATGLAPTPAHAAPAAHPHGFARTHRSGVSAPATTASSVIDVVVPLHVAAAARRSVETLAHSHLSATARRAQVRNLAPSRGHSLSVVRWARAHGFAVTATTPWTVSLRGTAGSLAAAFGTSLWPTRHRGKSFAAPRSAPAVPAALRGLADAPVGLDTRPIWSGHAVYGGGDVQVLNSTPVRGSAAGAGSTVATVNLSGWHSGDLTTYRRAAFGTTDTPPAVTNVVVGAGHVAATVDESDFGDEVEVALDAETIAGVAPSAAQRMYFGGNTGADYVGILNKMASDLSTTPGIFTTASTSWGACERDIPAADFNAMRSAITTITALGATFFASSGDNGAFDCEDGGALVDFPSSAESSVAVGGTTVSGSAPAYGSAAWSGSGGGCSTRVAQPSRQTGLSPCLKRAVPDIATIADPQTGVWVYDRLDGWMPIGGTSVAAPAAAAGLAVTQAHAALVPSLSGNFLDAAYATPAAFVDVVSGDNGAYRAAAGYDLVTGLGSPRWTALEAALTGNAAPTPIGHNQPLLVVNPSADPDIGSLQVQIGTFASESSFVANGEPASGYAASATSPTTCASATGPAPDEVVLPGGQGTVQVSLSLATSDPDVAGGCLTVQRPLVVDSVSPGGPVPVVSYVGTTAPAYRFSWAAATDSAPSSGVAFYAAFVTDTSTGADAADFFTVGRGFPYASDAPFKAIAGHGYAVQLFAVDVAGNYIEHDVTFRAPYDDSKATLSKHLSGSTSVSDWTRTKASPDFLGSHVASNRKGASFGLSFTGKTLTAGMLKSRYGGYADIYVDGVRKVRISVYRSATAYRQAVRLATFSTSGTHTVVVKVVGAHQSGALGNYVFLDSLTVA